MAPPRPIRDTCSTRSRMRTHSIYEARKPRSTLMREATKSTQTHPNGKRRPPFALRREMQLCTAQYGGLLSGLTDPTSPLAEVEGGATEHLGAAPPSTFRSPSCRPSRLSRIFAFIDNGCAAFRRSRKLRQNGAAKAHRRSSLVPMAETDRYERFTKLQNQRPGLTLKVISISIKISFITVDLCQAFKAIGTLARSGRRAPDRSSLNQRDTLEPGPTREIVRLIESE